MYELVHATPSTAYIDCPSKMGIYYANGRAYLIDSGNGKDAAKRALRALRAEGYEVGAVYNTHFHGDHIGGNAYLARECGCPVYAPEGELSLVRHPSLEPALLFGGYPPKELRSRFFIAEASDAAPITEAVLPEGLSLLSLPGHSPDGVGFRTMDGAVFLGDCLAGRDTFEKYGVCVLQDVGAYLETARRVRDMEAALFILSHVAPTEDIRPLAEYNIQKVEEVSSRILSLCKTPVLFDELLGELFTAYGQPLSLSQYALVGSTVRSYLSYLSDLEEITAEIAENRLFWMKK